MNKEKLDFIEETAFELGLNEGKTLEIKDTETKVELLKEDGLNVYENSEGEWMVSFHGEELLVATCKLEVTGSISINREH